MNKKIAAFISLSFLMILFWCTSVFAYTDVSSTHWAYNAINKLSEIGALNGYSDGSFRPNQSITRAEFCKIVAELMGSKTQEQNNIGYQDVNRFHWAYEYIKKASLYFAASQNRFYPDNDLLRQDAALAMINILGKQNEEYRKQALHELIDEKLVSEEYEKYIALAIDYEVMRGNADGTFNPLGSVTRAEMCQIIYNIILKSQNDTTFAVFNTNNVKVESTNINSNTTKDENGIIIVKPIVKTYTDPNIWLNVTIEGSILQDGGTYTIGKDEYIRATICNPSNEKDFIYYSLAYGTNFQTIVVQKASSSSTDIIIPEELVGKTVKISIWGASTKNGKGYMTATQVFIFNYTGDLSHRGESYSENYNEKIENRKADFIVLYNGITIEPDKTIEGVRQKQNIIIRSKPVYNIESINYRWDKDIEYTVVNHATETIEIPSTFTEGSSHKLTVRIIDKDGNVYMPRVFNFTMYENPKTSEE